MKIFLMRIRVAGILLFYLGCMVAFVTLLAISGVALWLQ